MFAADTYKQFFRCYPVTQLDASEEKRHAGNFGGKIYLPSSALVKLTTLRISYPMLFEIRAPSTNCTTHAGVLEFVAPEGRCYLPEWMMQTLGLQAGALIDVRSVSLSLGTFAKFEPQTVEFLEISDPKAVLENTLRNFSALTINDIFKIAYNGRIYPIKVLEVKPVNNRNSVCLVETDLEVDFAPPVGYVEPTRTENAPKKTRRGSSNQPNRITAGQSAYQELIRDAHDTGSTLSGQQPAAVPEVDASIYSNRDAPSLVLPDGQLFFGFPLVPLGSAETKEDQFGEGRKLKG